MIRTEAVKKHQTDHVLIGDGFLMRPINAGDVTQAYVDGLNDPEVGRFLTAGRKVQTLDSVRSYVAMNADDPVAILFGIFVDDLLRGTVRLHKIGDGFAYVGIAIFDKSLWGKGLATRTIKLVSEFAIASLGVTRIDAGRVIAAGNLGSHRAFEKAGYQQIKPGLWRLDASLKTQ